MRQLLKSTTALVLATAIATPHTVMAQGEADPQLERQEQQQQNEAEQAAKAAAEAERQAAEKAERKAEKQAERKAERKQERQQQREAEAEAEAEAKRDQQQREAEATRSGNPEGDPVVQDMERDLKREQRRAERQAQRAAEAEAAAQAAAAAAADAEAGAEVIEEQITDGDVRSSDEEFAVAPQQAAPVAEDDDGLSDGAKIALLGLGALAVGQLLKNGDKVVSNSGDRVVVQTDDGMRVLKNDDVLLRQPGADVRTERFTDGSTRSYVTYADGSQVVTVLSPERDRLQPLRQRRRPAPRHDGNRVCKFRPPLFAGPDPQHRRGALPRARDRGGQCQLPQRLVRYRTGSGAATGGPWRCHARGGSREPR